MSIRDYNSDLSNLLSFLELNVDPQKQTRATVSPDFSVNFIAKFCELDLSEGMVRHRRKKHNHNDLSALTILSGSVKKRRHRRRTRRRRSRRKKKKFARTCLRRPQRVGGRRRRRHRHMGF